MWRIHHFSETDSTNRLAKDGEPGDVFTADHQSAGRGRLDHKWLSPPGQNLMMSAVVDVAGMEPSEVATFPLVAGLAVADALSPLVAGLRIKWPNDIVVVADGGGDWCKLSGILCERYRDIIVAGIGVNILQSEFPAELAQRATSLRLLGCDASVAQIRDAVLASLSRIAGEWRRGGFATLLPALDAIDILKGRVVSVLRTDDDMNGVCGMCDGIAPDGSLFVAGERIYAGEAHVVI